jgi:hypothetical protein
MRTLEYDYPYRRCFTIIRHGCMVLQIFVVSSKGKNSNSS